MGQALVEGMMGQGLVPGLTGQGLAVGKMRQGLVEGTPGLVRVLGKRDLVVGTPGWLAGRLVRVARNRLLVLGR